MKTDRLEVEVYIYVCVCVYLSIPMHELDVAQGQFLSGVKQVWI